MRPRRNQLRCFNSPIAANYGGTLTQPANSFNNPVTTGDAIVVFVSWLSTDGYVVSVTDSRSDLY